MVLVAPMPRCTDLISPLEAAALRCIHLHNMLPAGSGGLAVACHANSADAVVPEGAQGCRRSLVVTSPVLMVGRTQCSLV